MSENLRHWNALRKTDPSHTKPFTRAGGFKGTAIKPIYMVEKMTEHFGPCGVGWGMEAPDFVTYPVGDELLVYCTVAVWFMDGDKRAGPVYGVGGDKVAVKRQSGVIADDEAFKKAYTDALSNAMKQIGVGADVHMGLFDDAKYVSELRREFADEETPAVPSQRPTASAKSPVPSQQQGPKYDLLDGKEKVIDTFRDPMDYLNALRTELKKPDAMVVAIWENNKGVARNIERAHPDLVWRIRDKDYHPVAVLEAIVEQLVPGIAA